MLNRFASWLVVRHWVPLRYRGKLAIHLLALGNDALSRLGWVAMDVSVMQSGALPGDVSIAVFPDQSLHLCVHAGSKWLVRANADKVITLPIRSASLLGKHP